MSYFNAEHRELFQLLERQAESELSASQVKRLEQLVLTDEKSRRIYIEYQLLHGTLHWDTAVGTQEISVFAVPTDLSTATASYSGSGASRDRAIKRSLLAAIAVVLLVGVGVAIGKYSDDLFPQNENIADVEPEERTTPKPPPVRPKTHFQQPPTPLVLQPNGNSKPKQPVEQVQNPPLFPPKENLPEISSEQVVSFIDEQLQAGWEGAEVKPSPRVGDAEWFRRVSLDLTGRIPTADDVQKFLADRRPNKRVLLVESLLDQPAYVHHLATTWSNLLVGRSSSRAVDRPSLHQFLRDAFAQNRPWSDVVHDLVSAEGTAEENGAANFMLAHLNNEAVPATAITARLFLGIQVQCIQCHDHPDSNNDWKQNQFWELNSFFQQTEMTDRRRQGDSRMELVSNTEVTGPMFFENRQGLMRAAYPRFSGKHLDANAKVNRREQLAEWMVDGENTQLAKALVNRLWSHFMGVGFTSPVDDMGPHNPPSHPLLLSVLAEKFVESGYDVKQLIRWITASQAYQLSSRFNESNESDNPEVGDLPMFSRGYVKPMTPEQVYDSFLVATMVDQSLLAGWTATQEKRQEWLQQFVHTYENEENNEASLFEGTVPQALMMMNGDLIQEAISLKPGTYLHKVISQNTPLEKKVHQIALATLSRNATREEIAAARRMLRNRQQNSRLNTRQATAESLQDLFWAYLNSSEFVLVH